MKLPRLTLIIALTVLPSLIGCSSTNRPSTVVKLELDEYPKTLGEDYDAYEVAVFVKKRTDFARLLWQEDRLDDCIMVLEDLVRNIPSSIRNRYDLGMMYYQRAFPHIKKYREISQEITTLYKKNEVEKAEDLANDAAKVYNKLKNDCNKALNQFTLYSQRVPQDPRPVDMMWRCQLALDQYVQARDTITRMIGWEGVLDDQSRDAYIEIQKMLNDYLLQTGRRGPLVIPNRLNQPRRRSSNN